MSTQSIENKRRQTTNLLTDERRLGKITAYIATIVFALSLLRFYFIPRLSLSANSVALAIINGWLPIIAHVLLFPVVSALPAPKWAKAAGYGWLMIDITTDVLALNGIADTLYLPIRYGGHIGAALWIISASCIAKGWTRIIGIVLGLDLGLYSFIPHGLFVLLIPSGFLLPVWFFFVGYFLGHEDANSAFMNVKEE